MKRAVVVYCSKYGFTKTYASWLADSLSCDLYDSHHILVSQLMKYDVILFGGGIYAGSISGASLIKKNFTSLKDKTLVIFTVGLGDPAVSDVFSEVEGQFTPEIKSAIHFFHLRGGIDFPTLSFLHRMMMAMMKKMLLKKSEKERTNGDRELLKLWGTKVDFTDQKSLTPILTFTKGALER